MMPLSLQSEPYSASGNLAADGFKKLLGTPTLDLLSTVIREALQNSCDAAKRGKGPTVLIRLRELSETERDILENVVLSHPIPDSKSSSRFKELNNRSTRWILEISDVDTVGLTGPTRADRIPSGCADTDFIDFLRNIGSRRDTHHGGGTYGYGKTALYLSSEISTILVDSQTNYQGRPERRFIGCHLGEAFETTGEDGALIRYTGRHWWGRCDSEGIAAPAINDDADSITKALGILGRTERLTGTTISIIDPVFLQGEDAPGPAELIASMEEVILWYFWPRMMPSTPEEKRLNIKLMLNNESITVKAPEHTPPIDLFCEAMDQLRKNSGDLQIIRSQRPIKDLGTLSIKKDINGGSLPFPNSKINLIPAQISHIALMRPVELVIKYIEGAPLPDNRTHWAGVFRCYEDVEDAFAKAEPPAHDDWIPDNLPKSKEKTYVNVALKKLKESAFTVANPIRHSGTSDGQSVAEISKLLGSFLMNGTVQSYDDSHTDTQKRTTKKGKRTRANHIKFRKPSFVEILPSSDNETCIGIFSLEIDSNVIENAENSILINTGIALDGSETPEDSDDIKSPEVIKWYTDNGIYSGTEETIRLNNFKGTVFIEVEFSRKSAVTLSIQRL